MDSTFTKREIYGERVVKGPVNIITSDYHSIMADHLVLVKGTQATSEILAVSVSGVTTWPVFV